MPGPEEFWQKLESDELKVENPVSETLRNSIM
jgi:hypothetical protein